MTPRYIACPGVKAPADERSQLRRQSPAARRDRACKDHGQTVFSLRRDECRQVHRIAAGGAQLRGARPCGAPVHRRGRRPLRQGIHHLAAGAAARGGGVHRRDGLPRADHAVAGHRLHPAGRGAVPHAGPGLVAPRDCAHAPCARDLLRAADRLPRRLVHRFGLRRVSACDRRRLCQFSCETGTSCLARVLSASRSRCLEAAKCKLSAGSTATLRTRAVRLCVRQAGQAPTAMV